MGKRLIQQARGKGGPTYRSPSHRFRGKISHPKLLKTSETSQGTIKGIVHCPGHSAPLMVIEYQNGESVLAAAPESVHVGQKVEYGANVTLSPGAILSLKDIPEGTAIFNIERSPGDGGKFVRSSGTCAKILTTRNNKVVVQLPSKQKKEFDPDCRAMIGTVAGGGRKELPIVKAGKMYHKKRARNRLYPSVSGASMNAVDHPLGGARSSRKGRPTIAPRNAPPGRKVGMLKPSRSGRGRGVRRK